MQGRLRPRLLLLLVSLTAVLVVAETAARLWLRHGATADQLRRYASIDQAREWVEATGDSLSLYEPHPYVGCVTTANYRSRANRHNAVGTRGEELGVPKARGSKEMRAGIEELNQLQREIARDLDISFFDLAAVFPMDEALFFDPIHMTAAGAALQAQLLAEFQLQPPLIPEREPQSEPALEPDAPEGPSPLSGSAVKSTSR